MTANKIMDLPQLATCALSQRVWIASFLCHTQIAGPKKLPVASQIFGGLVLKRLFTVRNSILAALLGLIAMASAAAPPAFPTVDIYVARLTGPGCPCAPTNITRRAGYDNQPRFLPDGSAILYTADNETGATDIYRLTLASGARSRVTATPESEFSPTLMPDGRHVSVVRIEPDLRQHLWVFPLPRAGAQPAMNDSFKRVLDAPEPVGYHVWIDAHTLALYVLGEPNALYVADTVTGKSEKFAERVGRSLQRIPGGRQVSFVDLAIENDTHIRSYDPATQAITDLVRPLRAGDVDYAWTPDGRIVMAQGAALFVWNPLSGGAWLPFADFATSGLTNITRLSFSPDGTRLALVADDGG